ncbi:diguanylate cyclase [Porticoccaceae bacterium LTM1]|nr:diguanylate cyclase [Porticoccaceae bacterium LTM1]
MEKNKLYLTLFISVLLIGGFLATSYVSYFVAYDELEKQLSENTLPLTSNNIYSEIQQDLLRPIFISSLMAHDTFVRDWALDGEQDPQKMIRFLSVIEERYATTTSYFVSEATRRYYHPTGIIKTVDSKDPADKWYFRSRSMQDDYEINIDTDTADKSRISVFINYKVYGYEGELIGVTGVGLELQQVKELIYDYEQRYGRTVLFIDQSGNIKLQRDEVNPPAHIRDREGMAPIATALLATTGGSFNYLRDNQTVFVNARLVPEFKWLLLVEQQSRPVVRQIKNTLFINIAIAVAITALVLIVANLTVGSYQNRLEIMASRDKLTGAMTRQAFDGVLHKTLTSAKRKLRSCSVLLFDLDNFKQVNDRYGHLCGDQLLKMVADTVTRLTRKGDYLCRWGGEEFILLAQDCDLDQARILAEKIRLEIETQKLRINGEAIAVTASFGVGEYLPSEREAELIHRVDQALYQAKQNGRNRVEIST